MVLYCLFRYFIHFKRELVTQVLANTKINSYHQQLYNSVCLEVIMFPGRDQLSQEGSQINIIADKTHAITIITRTHNVLVDLRL